jgi:hypothetical protein
MAKQSKPQKETVERVMHEFKHGELRIQGGRKVKNPKQAIAIALREAGASNQESPKKNRQNLRKTKAKESGSKTGQARKARAKARKTTGGKGDQTRADLYEQAKRRDLAGRSRMSKADLQRALRK